MQKIRKIKVVNEWKNRDSLILDRAFSYTLEQRSYDIFTRLIDCAVSHKQAEVQEDDLENFLSEEKLQKNEFLDMIHTFDDLGLITHNLKDEEIVISISNPEEIRSQEDIQNNYELDEFVSSIKQEFEDDFEIGEEALRIIMKNIGQLDHAALREIIHSSISLKRGTYRVCPVSLTKLIRYQKKSKPISFEKQRDFWRYLESSSNTEIEKGFNELFSGISPLEMFKALSKQDQVPCQFISWIRWCQQEKRMEYKVINGLLSFVMSLLGKMPIKYMAKTSNTLADSYSNDMHGLVYLVKQVISSDIKNGKNRLGVPTHNRSKPVKKAKRTAKLDKDFVCYI